MINICPICQKDDLVQRVETLVAAGQSSGTFSGPSVGATYSDGKFGTVGGYTTLSGSTSSNLAKLLQPPSLPPKPKGFGCWWILIAYPVIPLVASFFSIPFLIPCLIATAIWGWESTISQLFMGLGILLGYYFAIRFFIRKERKKKAKMEQELNDAKPKWEKAINRWKGLYYCHRDGIVYNPESSETCAPGAVKEFLFRQT